MRPPLPLLAGVLAVAALLPGCRKSGPAMIVAYISLDEPYARPVLDAFQRETGLRVAPVFDTEAAKSRGLAERILAERGRPRADLFWSSEVMQMVSLRKQGVLEAYHSPSAEGIPDRYRDPGGFWTGFAARCRVMVYNRSRVKTPPKSLLDLVRPEWRGETVLPNPRFGSTTTEAVALFQILGPQRAEAYFRARAANATVIVDGNSVSAERVARGDSMVGQTDTDDAFIRVDQGRPLTVVFPDQQGIGALLIPNTVGLVRGGPHPAAARRFIDFLLRPQTELILSTLPSRQLPLHTGLESQLPEKVRPLTRVHTMKVDYNRLIEQYPQVDAFLRQVFAR